MSKGMNEPALQQKQLMRCVACQPILECSVAESFERSNVRKKKVVTTVTKYRASSQVFEVLLKQDVMLWSHLKWWSFSEAESRFPEAKE